MDPHYSMRTKTWSSGRTTFPLKSVKNGRGAKACSQIQGPYEPPNKATWNVESRKGIVYGLPEFPSICTILCIALWGRAPTLPFSHVPICIHGCLGI